MNKKIKIETGFVNSLAAMGDYEEHDIIWFPQGVYVINSFNSSYTTTDYQISISGQDKIR